MTLLPVVAPADYAPNLNTIITSFAALIGLFILREFQKLYDWRVKNGDMPDLLKALGEKLDGVVKRFDDHCREEEQWQKDAVEANASAARMTREAIMACEERLGQQIAGLSERRQKPR